MLRNLLVRIDGTATHCHSARIPNGVGPCGSGDYPSGTCPYFRQFPNGDEPQCLLFQREHAKRHLSRSSDGLALRVFECLAASEQAGKIDEVLVEIVAGDVTCETSPVIDTTTAHPWTSCGSGRPTVYHPHLVCRYYVTFHNGSSHCRLPRFVQLIGRDKHGLTRRLSICLKAEASATQSGT